MLGLAEYVAQSAELQQMGQRYEQKIRTLESPTYTDVKYLVSEYINEYRAFLLRAMVEVADNAVNHYQQDLGIQLDDSFTDDLVDNLFDMRYHGATLNDRLVIQARQLQRRLAQSALVHKMDKTWTSSVPFGSQTLADRRLLLGMLSKVENEVAKQIAIRGDIQLIRWRTSHRHAKPDICDDLASYIDKRVVNYLNENNFKEDPRGLYFAAELPDPPHPNCQCEYSLTIPGVRRTESLVKRAANKVRSILRRIRGK